MLTCRLKAGLLPTFDGAAFFTPGILSEVRVLIKEDAIISGFALTLSETQTNDRRPVLIRPRSFFGSPPSGGLRLSEQFLCPSLLQLIVEAGGLVLVTQGLRQSEGR